MIRILIIFLAFSLLGNYTFGQSSLGKLNEISLEAGGPGGFGSLNYHRYFKNTESLALNGKIGFSFFRFYDFQRKFNPDLLFPFGIELQRKYNNLALKQQIFKLFTSFSGRSVVSDSL